VAVAALLTLNAACTAADENSLRDRPSIYAAYGGRGGVPSGGGP